MIAAALLFAAVFTRAMERVSTMDPSHAQTVYDSRAIQLVCDTILAVDYSARPYRIVPGYCELPTVSADGLVYLFRVRAGGAAENVVRTLEDLRRPSEVSPSGWIMNDVDTVKAIDAEQIEIKLKRRLHYFPWLMTMGACSVREANGEGTGPYRLAAWRKNHEMVFVRREGRSVPDGFDEIRYLVIDDVSTQWLMFLKGEIDLLGEISRDNWDAVIAPDGRLDPELEKAGVKLHTMPTLEVLYLGFNMRDKTVGGNRKLRQALNAAFDYPAWERFYNGRVVECTGPIPYGVKGRLDTPFAYSHNLEKAKRLLAEAGYPGGIDPATGRRLVLTLAIGRPNQESREAAELTAAFYAKIGIKLELQFMTWNAYLKAVDEGRVQIFRMGWVGDYPDAQNFLQLFHSANVSPGPNRSHYVNAQYDREYEAALSATDDSTRNRHWRRCQEILREDCPWVFAHHNKASSLVRARVKNYIPSDFPYGSERFYKVGSDK